MDMVIFPLSVPVQVMVEILICAEKSEFGDSQMIGMIPSYRPVVCSS